MPCNALRVTVLQAFLDIPVEAVCAAKSRNGNLGFVPLTNPLARLNTRRAWENARKYAKYSPKWSIAIDARSMTQCALVRFAKNNLELLSGHRGSLFLFLFSSIFFYTALLNPDNPGRRQPTKYCFAAETTNRIMNKYSARVSGVKKERRSVCTPIEFRRVAYAEDREVATELRGTILSSSLSAASLRIVFGKITRASERASEIERKEGRDRTLGLEGLSC